MLKAKNWKITLLKLLPDQILYQNIKYKALFLKSYPTSKKKKKIMKIINTIKSLVGYYSIEVY